MKLTLQQLEAHLWGAANILRGKTAGQDYKNYILSLMFYKRLCDQWECEADDAIAEHSARDSDYNGVGGRAVSIRPIFLLAGLGLLAATSADARTVCRTTMRYIPFPGGLQPVPESTCYEVADPPPLPPPDYSKDFKLVREKCAAWKVAYGEEKGGEMCRAAMDELMARIGE